MFRSSITSALALGALLVDIRAQNDYYVNGLTGLDVPSNGSSASQPWRTLTYAFSRIPTPVDPDSHRIIVAGGQVYSAGTNGETFPIRPTYNVSVSGGAGVIWPVIRPPAGATAFQLDPAVVYNRNQVTYEYLVFAEGAIGIAMGAGPGSRHRPRISHCEFLSQTVAGVDITTRNANIDDPRLFASRFYRCDIGLRAGAGGPNAVMRPDVEECAFEECVHEGVLIDDRAQGGSDVGGLLRTSFFNLNGRGARLQATAGAVNSRLEVDRCCFRCNGEEGLDILVNRPADPSVTVSRCVFIQGTYGVRAQGVFTPGSYTFTLRDNAAIECRIAAYSYQLAGSGNVRLTSTNNIARAGHDGFEIAALSPGVVLDFTSDGDRAWANAGNGFALAGNSAGSTASVVNGMFVDNALDGLLLAPMAMTTQARFLTLADNRGVGLRAVLVQGPVAIDHCIIADNAPGELAVPAGTPIRFSCLQNASYPGQGNLQANPRLVRPFYKIASASPCVDAGDPLAATPARDYEGDGRRLGPRPDMGADEFVTAGSAHTYGVAGVGHPAFVPLMSTPNTDVRIGQTLRVDVVNAVDFAGQPALGALLFLGSSEAPGLFPYDLTASGATASLLWQNMRFVTGITAVAANGTGSVGIPLPNNPGLIDQTVTFQWFVVKPGCNQAGFVTTDALRATIGQ